MSALVTAYLHSAHGTGASEAMRERLHSVMAASVVSELVDDVEGVHELRLSMERIDARQVEPAARARKR